MNITYVSFFVNGITAAEDYYLPMPADSSPYSVVSAVFLPSAAVAAHGSNHWTIALKATDGEAGTPGSSMGGFTTDSGSSGISLAVNDKVAISLTAGNAQIDAGGSVLIDIDEGGTADALEGVFLLGLQKRPPA